MRTTRTEGQCHGHLATLELDTLNVSFVLCISTLHFVVVFSLGACVCNENPANRASASHMDAIVYL